MAAAATQVRPSGEGWKNFSYNAALDYHDVGAGFQAVQYRVNALGRVEVRGVAAKTTAGASGQIVGSLPAGYRPAAIRRFISALNTSTLTVLDVQTNGDVVIRGAAVAGSGIPMEFSFDPA